MTANWKEVKPEALDRNPFHMIGKEWLLVTAQNEGKANTMTASWGGVGVLWNRNVVFLVIRPQRYTREFLDASDTFSVTVLGENYRKQLNYLGTVSGRDEDKIKKAGLTLASQDDIPYFEEGSLSLLCRKLYTQPLTESGFPDKKIPSECYSAGDYHILYVGEILHALVKN